MIKVVKDNAILSIEQEDLAQYEARGYKKLGATKKVAPKDIEKEVNKLKKANEELVAKVTSIEKEKEDLIESNKELVKKLTELESKLN